MRRPGNFAAGGGESTPGAGLESYLGLHLARPLSVVFMGDPSWGGV